MSLPFSQACENNKAPILAELKPLLADRQTVLEIGSGTGQHAHHFAAAMPHLLWQCSDRPENLDGIRAWLAECEADTPEPLQLDVRQAQWPALNIDAAYSANTLHIMDWSSVCCFFAGLGKMLPAGAPLVVYGPFKHQGAYTSDSNIRFDEFLQQRDPASGIRDTVDLDQQASLAGFQFERAVSLPANNELRIWRKQGD